MALLGFILGGLVLGYVTFAIVVMFLVSSAFGAPPVGKEWLVLIGIIGFVGWLWYLLFSNAPFTLTVTV